MRIKQGMDSSIEKNSVALLSYEFTEQKADDLSFSSVRHAGKKEICHLKFIYISVVKAN